MRSSERGLPVLLGVQQADRRIHVGPRRAETASPRTIA
jgi:hypothetical protein